MNRCAFAKQKLPLSVRALRVPQILFFCRASCGGVLNVRRTKRVESKERKMRYTVRPHNLLERSCPHAPSISLPRDLLTVAERPSLLSSSINEYTLPFSGAENSASSTSL